MAVTWAVESGVTRTANGGYSVMPENVILKPELNGRSEETSVEELAEDILYHGQIVPALCYKSPEGYPILLAGHRRLRAIVLLNKSVKKGEEKKSLIFNYAYNSEGKPVKTEEEALDITVAENRNRTDVNPLDDAANCALYAHKFGKSTEEIAKKYFPGADTPEKLAKAVLWVKERQKLLELSPEAQDKLRKGEFSTSAAMQLSKLQPVAQNKLLKEKEKSGEKLKVKDVQEKVAEVQGKPAPKPAKQHDISENTPSKLLVKYKVLIELAGALAAEVVAEDFSRDYDKDTAKEFAYQIAVACRKLSIPLEASLDKWASQNLDTPTVLDNF